MLDLKNLGGIMKVHLTLFRAIFSIVLFIILPSAVFAQPDTLWTKTFDVIPIFSLPTEIVLPPKVFKGFSFNLEFKTEERELYFYKKNN